MITFILATVACAAIADAQIITWFGGSCPDVTTKDNFQLQPYMGRWYEISKYPNSFQNGECGSAQYTLQDDNIVRVNNTQIKEGGIVDTVIGQVRDDPSSDVPAHLQVRFSSWQPWGKYWVLDTDYESYTVVYSCSYYIINKVEFLWILGRDRTVEEETRKNILQMLENFKIDATKMVDTVQDVNKCNV
ncbi:apolipoprotein D-like [Branchiostoma lanceolatum]